MPVKLKKVEAKCGCDGCYYDNFEKCPIVEASHTSGYPYNSENWECVQENCIFIKEDD